MRPSIFERCLKETSNGLAISVLLSPRASRNQVVGEHDGRLKVSIKAPPVDGAANKALKDFLAALFSIPKANLRLLSGERGRRKVVLVQGLSKQNALDSLAQNWKQS